MEGYWGFPGWDDDTEALRSQLRELQYPTEKMVEDIEKRREEEREKLRKEIRKLGGKPII